MDGKQQFEYWYVQYCTAKERAVDDYIEHGGPDRRDVVGIAQYQADEALGRLLKRGTEESWRNISIRIWERDGPVCRVCLDEIPIEHYDCGHIVDRVCGGTDRDENLTVMCNACNRSYKPLHNTRAEYDDWIKEVREAGSIHMWVLRQMAAWDRDDTNRIPTPR